MNDLNGTHINPNLVVRTRPALKRRVRVASDNPRPSIDIAYALVYGLSSALVLGMLIHAIYTLSF
jgi:hypothetical protein